MKKSLFILFFIASFSCFGQDMARVKQTVDSLCSPAFMGRGAGGDGQKHAASYISSQFSEIGLKPLSKSYFQPFSYNTNTFSGNLALSINGTLLNPGVDYIVDPRSPSKKGVCKILAIDDKTFDTDKKVKRFLNKNLTKTTVLYTEETAKSFEKFPATVLQKIMSACCLVEIKEKKLTMGIASSQAAIPTFQILKSSLPADITKIDFDIEATLLENYEGNNVLGYIPGALKPDSFVFVSAHYDHLGLLGKNTFFPGANDNGSGVSMLLELARYYKANPSPLSIVFVAFGAEEAGLIGSRYYTENPIIALPKIKFLINLDLMGTGDEGMMVVNGAVFTKEFALLDSINTADKLLPTLKKRGKAANSDHYFFTEKGVPAFFFYTLGGIAAYHDVFDVPQTLPYTKYKEAFSLITKFIQSISQ